MMQVGQGSRVKEYKLNLHQCSFEALIVNIAVVNTAIAID